MAKRRARNRELGGLSEHQARLYKHEIWARVATRVGRAAVSWAGFGFCVYWGAQTLIEWSGQAIVADLRLALSGSGWRDVVVLIAVLLGAGFGAGGLAYGRQRARLMRETVRHFEGPKKARETALDPQRSSSGLTRAGETPDEED